MWLRRNSGAAQLLSAFEDARGDQYVGGLSLDERRVFGARVPMRAHGCAVDPRDATARAVLCAPSRHAGVRARSRDSMQVRTAFATPAGRHLAGHGVFSADGELLFTPEHDYENVRGVIAVRDARTFADRARDRHARHRSARDRMAAEPARTLLVANGGILTHPRTFRRKLNIPHDGSVAVRDRRAHRRMSRPVAACPIICSAFAISRSRRRNGARSDCSTKATREQAPGDRRAVSSAIGAAPADGARGRDAQIQRLCRERRGERSARSDCRRVPVRRGVACWSLSTSAISASSTRAKRTDCRDLPTVILSPRSATALRSTLDEQPTAITTL